ncbi:MAG: hypothetical protein ABL958_14345 [Bdellovibrionia bacterium]
MKLLTLLGVLLVSAQAFAFVPRMDSKITVKEIKKSQGAQEVCTNFTGHWVGECTDIAGKTEKAETYIYQGECDYLFIDGAFIAIGGTRSEAHAIPLKGGDLATGAITQLSWDAKMEAVGFNTKSSVYKTGLGYLFYDDVYGGAAIQNGKLVSYAKGNTTAAACVYTKATK